MGHEERQRKTHNIQQKIQHQNIINPNILKAVETSDKMTLNEIVAQVKDFYNP